MSQCQHGARIIIQSSWRWWRLTFLTTSLCNIVTIKRSPCTPASHFIIIPITHFALQSDSAERISDIIIWFPGGQLRLIDKPIHFLFRWEKAEEDEKARRSWRISKDHQRLSSLVANPAQCRAIKIAVKTVNDCHTVAERFCGLSGARRTPAADVCLCTWAFACALIWIWECVRVFVCESDRLSTQDYGNTGLFLLRLKVASINP